MATRPNTIFIADDDPLNLILVSRALAEENYTILTATNGKEAEALIINHAEQIDIILLDVVMPYKTGFEVCQSIKQLPALAKIPVLFLTNKMDNDSIITGFTVGGVDYVAKPFNRLELLARIKTHLTLRQSEKQLQILNASKDKFISIIANEFDSPISSLKGIFQMLATDFERLTLVQLRQYLELSYASIDRFQQLVSNLQTWSKLQCGELFYAPGELELRPLVATVGELLHSDAQLKKISLYNDIAEDFPVYADQHMLFMVLNNLLSNAIAFSFEGGGVWIEAQLEGDSVRVSVRDEGIGISPEDQQNLLRLENKVKHYGTLGESGTGMGLLLCHDLVAHHGGTLWIESEVDKGTCVFFTLPRRLSIEPFNQPA